jgi:hypothetical protein
MPGKVDEKDRMLLALTIIPITNFIGANYFYLGNIAVGWIKLALSGLLVWIIVETINNPVFGVIGSILAGLFFFTVSVVWWISDIYRVCIKNDLR